MQKKVFWITRNFPPLQGGMERLVYNAYQVTAKDFQVSLVGPKGCASFISDTDKVMECPLKPASLFLVTGIIKSIFLIIKNGRPDIVIGGSGFVAPIIVSLAKLFKTRSILLVHGLDLIAENKVYQSLFLPFIRRADLVITNSANTSSLAVNKGVNEERISLVHPGVDLPLETIDKNRARMELKIEKEHVLLSVGRLIPRKGISQFIQRSMPSIIQKNPDTVFLIAGAEPENALNKNSLSETEKILSAIQLTGLDRSIKLLGAVDERRLKLLFYAADVFVFPLIEVRGDVEGFGMVAVEAAAHGTPTIAFNNGGVSDALANDKSGKLIDPGDYDTFAEAILAILCNKEKNITSGKCRDFARNFSWQRYAKDLLGCINKVLENSDKSTSKNF